MNNRQIYKSEGEEMIWSFNGDGTPFRIKHINSVFIKTHLLVINDHLGNDLDWVYIFEDVLLQRRVNKISKIRSRI